MYLDDPIPLRSRSRGKQRGPGPSKGSAFIVIAALIGVNYFLFFAPGRQAEPPPLEERLDDGEDEGSSQASAESGASGAEGATRARAEKERSGGGAPGGLPRDAFGEPVGREVEGELSRNQTIVEALEAEGIARHTIVPAVQAMNEVFDFRKAQVGDAFTAWISEEGQLHQLRFRRSPLKVYEARRTEEGRGFEARKVRANEQVRVASVGCAIRSSLYRSLSRCGEDAELGRKLIDLFAWDIDFFQDIRRNDELRVLVEKVEVDGKFIEYGHVLAAEYDGRSGRHRVIRYENPDGQAGYYTPEGRAVRRNFLRSPLKYTEVSAKRDSAVRASLNEASPVVYDASEGTPIWAVAGGRIAFAGESGKLGTTVTVEHPNGFTSTYGHLGELGPDVELGAKLEQKAVVGHVGDSGQADHPKLFYSLRKDGELVNPIERKFSRGEPVEPRFHDDFRSTVEQRLQSLEQTPIIPVGEQSS